MTIQEELQILEEKVHITEIDGFIDQHFAQIPQHQRQLLSETDLTPSIINRELIKTINRINDCNDLASLLKENEKLHKTYFGRIVDTDIKQGHIYVNIFDLEANCYEASLNTELFPKSNFLIDRHILILETENNLSKKSRLYVSPPISLFKTSEIIEKQIKEAEKKYKKWRDQQIRVTPNDIEFISWNNGFSEPKRNVKYYCLDLIQNPYYEDAITWVNQYYWCETNPKHHGSIFSRNSDGGRMFRSQAIALVNSNIIEEQYEKLKDVGFKPIYIPNNIPNNIPKNCKGKSSYMIFLTHELSR